MPSWWTKKGATPVRFELTRENPNGLAGHRLNHSAKVSSYDDLAMLRLLKVESSLPKMVIWVPVKEQDTGYISSLI